MTQEALKALDEMELGLIAEHGRLAFDVNFMEYLTTIRRALSAVPPGREKALQEIELAIEQIDGVMPTTQARLRRALALLTAPVPSGREDCVYCKPGDLCVACGGSKRAAPLPPQEPVGYVRRWVYDKELMQGYRATIYPKPPDDEPDPVPVYAERQHEAVDGDDCPACGLPGKRHIIVGNWCAKCEELYHAKPLLSPPQQEREEK